MRFFGEAASLFQTNQFEAEAKGTTTLHIQIFINVVINSKQFNLTRGCGTRGMEASHNLRRHVHCTQDCNLLDQSG